ncbi:MAG: rubrerythrin family protein [Deltaproteobacteria bacterium]|jgi:rubrerythrin|nr:rubrerythrin family protein [Deltaproteobacteria bacterium]MCK5513362.1 rubrerythrin family protein [Deltaproteobacteria bacterium]NOQ86345.1 rubrerythrin family protein [Deltaproteobacteria bacterium]
MGNTLDNLKEAFAGESQANRTYLAFAKKADEEGYPQAARLFRAAADAETVHAHNHLNVLGGVKSTLENLQAAYEGEHEEFTVMYPGFIEQAKKEGNNDAIQTFYWANEVEKVHGNLYKQATDNLKSLKATDYYVCQRCGYTAEGNAPEKCPVCGASQDKFKKIE